MVAIGGYLARVYGSFVPATTLVRTLVATAGAALAVSLVPLRGKIVTLALASVAVVIYAVLLVATREIGANEIAAITGAVRKRLGRS